ncbi:MAG: AarF/UbiB family protein [Bacteroidota bacterium]
MNKIKSFLSLLALSFSCYFSIQAAEDKHTGFLKLLTITYDFSDHPNVKTEENAKSAYEKSSRAIKLKEKNRSTRKKRKLKKLEKYKNISLDDLKKETDILEKAYEAAKKKVDKLLQVEQEKFKTILNNNKNNITSTIHRFNQVIQEHNTRVNHNMISQELDKNLINYHDIGPYIKELSLIDVFLSYTYLSSLEEMRFTRVNSTLLESVLRAILGEINQKCHVLYTFIHEGGLDKEGEARNIAFLKATLKEATILSRKMVQKVVTNTDENDLTEEGKKMLHILSEALSAPFEIKDRAEASLSLLFGKEFSITALQSASVAKTAKLVAKERCYVVKYLKKKRQEILQEAERNEKFIARNFYDADSGNLLSLIEEVKEEIKQETDLSIERRYIELGRKMYDKKVPGIESVHLAVEDKNINEEQQKEFLAMEFIDGELFTDFCKKIQANTLDVLAIKKIKQNLDHLEILFFYHLFFGNGKCHADLHGGNILVDSNYNFHLIDYGRMCDINQDIEVTVYKDMVDAKYSRNGKEVMQPMKNILLAIYQNFTKMGEKDVTSIQKKECVKAILASLSSLVQVKSFFEHEIKETYHIKLTCLGRTRYRFENSFYPNSSFILNCKDSYELFRYFDDCLKGDQFVVKGENNYLMVQNAISLLLGLGAEFNRAVRQCYNSKDDEELLQEGLLKQLVTVEQIKSAPTLIKNNQPFTPPCTKPTSLLSSNQKIFYIIGIICLLIICLGIPIYCMVQKKKNTIKNIQKAKNLIPPHTLT